MNKFNLSPLTHEDLPAIKAISDANGNSKMWHSYFDKLVGNPYVWCARDEEGNVLGAGGCMEVSPHCGELWVLPNNEAKRNKVALVKLLRQKIDELLNQYPRLQMNVDANWMQGKKWAEVLGFKNEGIMSNYLGVGTASWRYALWV